MPAMAGGRHAAATGAPPGWSEYLDFDALREMKETAKESQAEAQTWKQRVAGYKSVMEENKNHVGSFRMIKGESGPKTLPPAKERIYTGTMHKKVIASRASGTVPGATLPTLKSS